ncbi:MAG: ABC transporter substrate-binding protein [Propionibacteriaceae bacterium]|nr:ABC transporter substrate-binding protein [Propionibacteriaceae bacterium]
MAGCSAPQSVDAPPAADPTSSPTAGGAAEPTGSAGTDTFVYGISGDPTSTNPINANDRWGLTTVNIAYSPLAHLNADGTTTNDLAESIEPSDDGLSVTVKLQDGLKWSDGEALTADDVVFTYTEKAKPENGNSDALWVGDAPITATKVDDLTVRFDLPSYSAAAIANLAFENYIIPEHVYADADLSGAELDPIAVGSGPYKLTQYERGQYLRFEANENYHGDAPNIKNLTLRIVSNADTVKAGLQTGELDASFVTPQQVPDLENSPVTVTPYPEGRVAYLGVVTAKVTDLATRQALFYSLNRDDILRASWLDAANYEPAYSILPPSNVFATEDVEHYDQDVEKAKQLLADAGANNVKLTLAYAGNDPAQTTQATLIQQQAQAAGITIELAGVEGAAVYAEIEKGAASSYDLFLGGYIMGPDPDSYSALYRSGAGANYFAYSNPATDALFDEGAQVKTTEERKAAYAKLQAQIADDAVMFPLGDNLKLLAVNDRITGVEEATPVPIYTLQDFGKLSEK